jgi:hypothetical protein
MIIASLPVYDARTLKKTQCNFRMLVHVHISVFGTGEWSDFYLMERFVIFETMT